MQHVTMTQKLKDYLAENSHSLVNTLKLADTTNEYLPDAIIVEQLANGLDISNVSKKDVTTIYDITDGWYTDHNIDEDFDEFWTLVYNIHGIAEELLYEF